MLNKFFTANIDNYQEEDINMFKDYINERFKEKYQKDPTKNAKYNIQITRIVNTPEGYKFYANLTEGEVEVDLKYLKNIKDIKITNINNPKVKEEKADKEIDEERSNMSEMDVIPDFFKDMDVKLTYNDLLENLKTLLGEAGSQEALQVLEVANEVNDVQSFIALVTNDDNSQIINDIASKDDNLFAFIIQSNINCL